MDQQTKDPDVLNVLVLERVDRTKNMARYYVLSVEPTLLAKSSLVRRWGRIGGAGRTQNRPSCFPAARADSAQHMARTQAAPRLPTPRLIAGSRLFAGVLLRPRRIRNARSPHDRRTTHARIGEERRIDGQDRKMSSGGRRVAVEDRTVIAKKEAALRRP